MWKWIRRQLLRIPMVRDWVISIEDSRARTELRKEYLPKIEKARSEKKSLDVQNLYAAWQNYQSQIDEPTYVDASSRLVRKARNLYVAVPPTPKNYEQGNDDWWFSGMENEWALQHATYQRLRGEVLEAQRAANDEWRKWATFLFALAGLFLGWASFQTKTKQPDPCLRNYYRNDAGACVFALTPAPQPVPVVTQPAPVPEPTPARPSKKKSSGARSGKKLPSAAQ